MRAHKATSPGRGEHGERALARRAGRAQTDEEHTGIGGDPRQNLTPSHHPGTPSPFLPSTSHLNSGSCPAPVTNCPHGSQRDPAKSSVPSHHSFAQSLQHGCCFPATLQAAPALPPCPRPAPAPTMLPHNSDRLARLAWASPSRFDSHRRNPIEARNLPCYSRNPQPVRHPTENMRPQVFTEG